MIKKLKKDNISNIVDEKYNQFNKNSFKTTEIIFLIVVTSIISLIMGYLLNNKDKKNDNQYIDKFIEQYNNIIDNYYEEVDEDKLLNGAIDGMLKTLDEHSVLIEEETGNSFYTNLNGEYEGLGVEIYNNENNDIVVLGVLENSPAEKAGIISGDIIKKIDEKDLTNTNIKELTKYVKENSKDNYLIIIERDGQKNTIQIGRSVVTIKSILSKTIERDNHKIGYIYISVFSSTTEKQFREALDKLEKDNIDSLIIDVRENTGGHLTTVSGILSNLLGKDKIIYQIEKDDIRNSYYSSGKTTKTYPIVVLQNKNSASASELLGAALKDSYGATIVGEYSYGKGTVQEVVDLGNGVTYKFTTKKWLTPNGTWINKTGVKPDIEVSLDEKYQENPNDETDNQLQTAINYIIENK